MQTVFNKSRLHGILLFFTFIFLLYAARLIYLQVIKYHSFKEKATNQYSFLLTLEPERGEICDRNMKRLARNLKVYSLYATPPHIGKKIEVASCLSEILNLDKGMLFERLNKTKVFVWLKRKLSDEETEKIKSMNMKGLGLVEENKRLYPKSSLASHVLGVVDIDNRGLEGIELFYDTYLKGEPGWKEVIRDAKGRDLISEETKSLPPCNGYNVILTIDENIQHITEKALDKVWLKYKAKGAMAIVMNPYNGEILALANRPTFDPNRINDTPREHMRNKVVTDCFEPGSVFKIVTASAVLNENIVDFGDVFFCEKGTWKVGGHLLHDHKPHGNLVFKEVIEKSSNIGTVKVALLLKEDNIYRYIKKFGFGSKTGVDLPGEIAGLLQPRSQWSDFTISSIPIGQEIAVTAIQMACAISTIANGGVYYRPMIVKEIQDRRGQRIKSFEPTAVRGVISEDAAMRTREILKGVVENGTGGFARLKGYTSAGKTGTGQKVESSGRYSHSRFFSSFIGFAPAEKPEVAVCVFVDEPQPVYYGSRVAAPVFKEIAEPVLRYLELEMSGIVKAIK